MICWGFGKIKVLILKIERGGVGALSTVRVYRGGMEGDMGTDQEGEDIGEDEGGR